LFRRHRHAEFCGGFDPVWICVRSESGPAVTSIDWVGVAAPGAWITIETFVSAPFAYSYVMCRCSTRGARPIWCTSIRAGVRV